MNLNGECLFMHSCCVYKFGKACNLSIIKMLTFDSVIGRLEQNWISIRRELGLEVKYYYCHMQDLRENIQSVALLFFKLAMSDCLSQDLGIILNEKSMTH